MRLPTARCLPPFTQSFGPRRREDLEDLLADPQYFQAVFHTLPQVRLLYQGQADLGSANESIASTSPLRRCCDL